jgi:hypothetical protein
VAAQPTQLERLNPAFCQNPGDLPAVMNIVRHDSPQSPLPRNLVDVPAPFVTIRNGQVGYGPSLESSIDYFPRAIQPLNQSAGVPMHYQVLQYPGVTLLLIHAWRKRNWRALSITLFLAALLYPIPAQILWAYYLRYHAWTAHSLPTLYICTSVPPLASLALFRKFLST